MAIALSHRNLCCYSSSIIYCPINCTPWLPLVITMYSYVLHTVVEETKEEAKTVQYLFSCNRCTSGYSSDNI